MANKMWDYHERMEKVIIGGVKGMIFILIQNSKSLSF